MFEELLQSDPTGLREKIEKFLSPAKTLAETIRLEVILAEVQAELGLIPKWAATEIARAGRDNPPSVEQVRLSHRKSGHPMVAILDAFQTIIRESAGEWLHFGTTTADIIRTVRMVQLHAITKDFLLSLSEIEKDLARIARIHRATPMVGRTLGRHALPITFGYKVVIWLADLRRCSDRLLTWSKRYPSGVLSGAVGTHAVMGSKGKEVESEVMARLGLGTPRAADSKGSTDVFADFGASLAITARIVERIAQEIFLLQGDDIREVWLDSSAVGSSTMPHKSNPSLCIEVMSCAREVSAALPVLLEWIVTIFERDSHQNGAALDNMCCDMAQLLSCMSTLITMLKVSPKQMLHNLERTEGAILTEHITLLLSDSIGRVSAHHLMRETTARMAQKGLTLTEALACHKRTRVLKVPKANEIIGLSPELVDQTLTELGYHE